MKSLIDKRASRTKEHLLNAAEHLFSERGLDGASMRDVTNLAGVNLASANYHFGGKEGLFRAVVERQSSWIAERRLSLLDKAVEKQQLTEIIRAFYSPTFEKLKTNGLRGRQFTRLMSRAMLEVPNLVESLVKEFYEPVTNRFAQAIADLRPEYDESDVFWSMQMVNSILNNTLLNFAILEQLYPQEVCNEKLAEIELRLTTAAEQAVKSIALNKQPVNA